MIFVLRESIMNGTVTMQTIVTGVRAKTFDNAKTKVLKTLNKAHKGKWVDKTIYNDDFRFLLTGSAMPVYGVLDKKPLRFFDEKKKP